MLTARFVWSLFLFGMTCGALGLSIGQTSPAADESRAPGEAEFTKALNRIIRAARERFRPVQSFRVDIRPGDIYWYEGQVVLPGAEYCRSYEHPRLRYVCQWTGKNTTSKYDGVVDRVRAALGDQWTFSASERRGRKMARFDPLDPSRTGSIEIEEGARTSEFSVRLSVFSAARW